MDIAIGLGIAKTSLDLIKGIRESLKKKTLSNDELVSYLSDLQDRIVDVKTALADADDENRELKRQIEELKRMAQFGSDFTSEEGVYWREGIPYCPICWDVDRKPVRLSGPIQGAMPLPGRMSWMCSLHKAEFAISRNRSQLK